MRLADLSHEQRRVMLAEADGWKQTRVAVDKHGPSWPVWERDGGGVASLYTNTLPRYDESLEACAALEAKLTDEQAMDYYMTHLRSITGATTDWAGKDIPKLAHASASQRASALLLTLCSEVEL